MDNRKGQMCTKCHKTKEYNANELKVKTTGELTKMCKSCHDRVSESRRDTAEEEKENGADEFDEALDGDDDAEGFTELTLEVFLDAISSEQKLRSFTALVDLSAIPNGGNDDDERLENAVEFVKKRVEAMIK
ncbi:hypothetical protein BDN70DRAFT_938846 [Pholiota conissans]|uniref:Doubled CXXCH motif domain-containing protein n=1 Tax=Pholiota conissans TaxID=109636 RepID=A0A9P6CRY4_9AGAR|nr:hypothetical protein BDN70DRAFT_938846 [Pholiota conissans]